MRVRQFAACNSIRTSCKIIYLGARNLVSAAINSFNSVVFGALLAGMKVKFQI